MRSAIWTLAATVALVGCRGGPEVARISNGRDVSGRYIEPEAYAAYLEGTLAEARGDLVSATERYRAVLAEDPGAAEAHARLGVTRCLAAPKEADESLTRARSLAPEAAATWVAEAECALSRGATERALSAARRALAISPLAPETSAVLEKALARSGRNEEAAQVRRAFALLHGKTLPAVRGEPGISARVTSRVLAFDALARGDLGAAERFAERALLSDPGDADAKIAALVAADAAAPESVAAGALSPLPQDRTEPTPESARLLEALLARRVGRDAARAFHERFFTEK